MKIITWNVNRFDGTWEWYSKKADMPIDKRKECANKIIEKLKSLLITPEDVAIIQEVPYRDFDWKDEWNYWQKVFAEFKTMLWFDDEPKRSDFYYDRSLNITLAVAKSDSN